MQQQGAEQMTRTEQLVQVLWPCRYTANTSQLFVPQNPYYICLPWSQNLLKTKKVRVNYSSIVLQQSSIFEDASLRWKLLGTMGLQNKSSLICWFHQPVFFFQPFPLLELHKAIYMRETGRRKLPWIFARSTLSLVPWDWLLVKYTFYLSINILISSHGAWK